MAKKKTRILISKLGLDGHDRGAKLVAHSLQEAGMDVTYLGIRHTVDEVVDKAIENKVDYLGLSFLAGDHLNLVRKVVSELEARNAGNVKLIVGGIILKEHVPELTALGVQHVFLPGTPLADIANYIKTESAKQAA